jgi:23S rRNA (guanosine2251-2'-O)-methyltransferase
MKSLYIWSFDMSSHRPPSSRHGSVSSQRYEGREHQDQRDALLYGFHPVVEALRNPRREILRLYLTLNAEIRLTELQLLKPDMPIEIVSTKELTRWLSEDAVHQGMMLVCKPLQEDAALSDVLDSPLLLALDQVTDPHNIGAILRSACAFGARGVLLTQRHAPHESAVLAKSASGALEHVPLVRVRNLSASLEELQGHGYQCIGFDSEAEVGLQDVVLSKKIVLVMGAEGKGLRQKTRTTCDTMVKLDMPGPIQSLNVSNAAAIALYACTTKARA